MINKNWYEHRIPRRRHFGTNRCHGTREFITISHLGLPAENRARYERHELSIERG